MMQNVKRCGCSFQQNASAYAGERIRVNANCGCDHDHYRVQESHDSKPCAPRMSRVRPCAPRPCRVKPCDCENQHYQNRRTGRNCGRNQRPCAYPYPDWYGFDCDFDDMYGWDYGFGYDDCRCQRHASHDCDNDCDYDDHHDHDCHCQKKQDHSCDRHDDHCTCDHHEHES